MGERRAAAPTPRCSRANRSSAKVVQLLGGNGKGTEQKRRCTGDDPQEPLEELPPPPWEAAARAPAPGGREAGRAKCRGDLRDAVPSARAP